MSAVMIRSVPNFQAGTGVRATGPRWTIGNHGVVGASTKKFPRFRVIEVGGPGSTEVA
jgi:hypothetical protein